MVGRCTSRNDKWQTSKEFRKNGLKNDRTRAHAGWAASNSHRSTSRQHNQSLQLSARRRCILKTNNKSSFHRRHRTINLYIGWKRYDINKYCSDASSQNDEFGELYWSLMGGGILFSFEDGSPLSSDLPDISCLEDPIFRCANRGAK
jgi:hypothetical protein